MKAQMNIVGKECFLFHNWKTEKDTGITKYQKCKRCGSKRIVQSSRLYQPVNWGYIKSR